jgi:hypothetical protein
MKTVCSQNASRTRALSASGSAAEPHNISCHNGMLGTLWTEHCRGALKSRVTQQWYENNSTHCMSSSIAASPTPSTTTVDGFIWEVLEIIAERTSITSGGNDILVVWKSSWMPLPYVIADSPAWRRWNASRKWKSSEACDNAIMQVTLPVEDGSVMAADLAKGYAVQARMYFNMERAALVRLERLLAADVADDGPSQASREQ